MGGLGLVGNCFCKLLLSGRPDYKVVNVDICTCVLNPLTI